MFVISALKGWSKRAEGLKARQDRNAVLFACMGETAIHGLVRILWPFMAERAS